MTQRPDITVTREGTEFWFAPRSAAANTFLDNQFRLYGNRDLTWIDAQDIARRAREAGFVVEVR